MIDAHERILEHYNIMIDAGYDVLGVFLQGSQNYDLAYEGSDVDSKAIVMPKFTNICLSHKPVSTTMILDNDEHIDIKDIRVMFDMFRKQNINFVEILFTKYFVVNPKYSDLWEKIKSMREKIVRYNMYKALDCIAGMSMQKLKALKHPYPSLIKTIEKFGYDPKQLHHIIRLNKFIKTFISGESYQKCLIAPDAEWMIKVKQGLVYNADEAEEIANIFHKETYSIVKEYKIDNDLALDDFVDMVLNETLVKAMRIALLGEEK